MITAQVFLGDDFVQKLVGHLCPSTNNADNDDDFMSGCSSGTDIKDHRQIMAR